MAAELARRTWASDANGKSSNATLSYSMYNPGPGGKNVKGMEISYKHVK